jgi:hypothetical protein
MKIKLTKEEKINRLCEAVADIAFTAGYHRYYTGDSRLNIIEFILWAKEFEKKWEGKMWGADDSDNNYAEEIRAFAYEKIKNAIKSNGKNG